MAQVVHSGVAVLKKTVLVVFAEHELCAKEKLAE